MLLVSLFSFLFQKDSLFFHCHHLLILVSTGVGLGLSVDTDVNLGFDLSLGESFCECLGVGAGLGVRVGTGDFQIDLLIVPKAYFDTCPYFLLFQEFSVHQLSD